jgi:hypothetical protein
MTKLRADPFRGMVTNIQFDFFLMFVPLRSAGNLHGRRRVVWYALNRNGLSFTQLLTTLSDRK